MDMHIYSLQAQAVLDSIGRQSEITAIGWQDCVKERFYHDYMISCIDDINKYINGGTGMQGMGLNELLLYLEEKLKELEALTGIGMPLLIPGARNSDE